MEINRKNKVILTIAFLLVAVIGVTFAYLTAFIGEGAIVDISASTDTVDSLMFEKGKDINIHANEDNFGKNVKNLVESTYIKARLIPNNTNNHAEGKYNVYFVIDANDFVYTTEDKKPELILKITNPLGTEVKELTGFTYDEELGGFDITTKRSSMYAFKIAEDYPIVANGKEEVQEWKIEVTLVNLPTSQNENGGRTFRGRIHITTDEKELYKLYNINKISTETTYESIDATLDIDKGTSEVGKYYYAIEKTNEEPSPAKISLLAIDLERNYIESDSPNIIFTTDGDGEALKENTNYKIYSYIVDEAGYQSNLYSTVVKTDEYNLVEVNSLDYTTTWNSISITGVKTNPGTGTAKEYSFWDSINREWSAYSTNQTYTINNLDELSQVTVKVQVKDSNGRYSNPYDKVIQTDAYDYPSITSFSVSDITVSSMKVKVGVTKGLGTLRKVEVQYDGEGETWHEATLIGDEYQVNFSNLNIGTKYTFKIRVTDEFKTKVYEDATYTGTTQNTHTVRVTVENGQVDFPSKDIVHGQTATFKITANPNYDITRATLKPNSNNKCKLSSDGTLTVENVTEDISCNVSIPINQYEVTLEVTNGTVTTKNPTTVDYNGTATFTIKANEGYDLAKAEVTEGDCTIDGSTVTAKNVISERTCKVNIPEKIYTLMDVCPTGGYLAECIKMLGNKNLIDVGDGRLYHHNLSLTNGAEDDSYRYAGNNPNNFVCLGQIQGDGSCDNVKNLYRIIGIFPFKDSIQQTSYQSGMEYRVKLIKSEYITENELKGTNGTGDGSTLSSSATDLARVETKTGIHGFYWNTNKYTNKSNWYNLWEYGEQKATLNIALNGTYLTNLENKIGSNKIAETKWHIGGYNTNKVTAKEMFDKEMGTNSEGSYPTPEDGYLSTNTKIGLMYASDYGFAAANNDNEWTSTLYNYDDTRNSNKENNWLYNGVWEWTVSRYSGISNYAFSVGDSGGVYSSYNSVDSYADGVRPVFYLNSDVTLISGTNADGSVEHPFKIN